MKTIEVHSVTMNTDGTEGRGRTVDTGIAFTTRDDAIEFAGSERYSRYAVMGVVNKASAKYNVDRKVLRVFESMEDYEIENPKAEKEYKRLAALAKLTAEDKMLLGLD